jgi:tetratricopeptide (TPR) repeat protein
MQWGNLLMDQKNYYAAIQYFESASTIHPDFIEPFLKIGLCYEELGEYSLACQAFEEALAIYPADPVAKEHLKRCQNFEGLPKQAPKEDVPGELKPKETKQVSQLHDEDLYEEQPVSTKEVAAQKESEPQKPQSEADIVMSILAQYSSDQDETQAQESDRAEEKPQTPAAPQLSVDDPVYEHPDAV